MSLEPQLRALRQSAALTSLDPVRLLRVSGPEAFELVDRLCPTPLFLRDGQARHSLLLDEGARIVADLLICRDDEDFLLLAEPTSPEALAAHLARHAPGDAGTRCGDVTSDFALLSLDGPYAWEVLAAVVGAEAVGLPYLSFFKTGTWTVLRSGKTGEYGYVLIVPREEGPQARARIAELGAPFDLAFASLEALDHCALENWFFNIRREGAEEGLTPLELQLQWRVSYKKPYVGAEALQARRATVAARTTCVLSASELRGGDEVRLGGERVGRVLHAVRSPWRNEHVGIALLDRAYAHAGLDVFTAARGPERTSLRTASAPVLDNASLYVHPQRHSYQTRQELKLPPLAPPLP